MFSVYLALVFVVFAIVYPMVAGIRWPSERVLGYRIGTGGAASVTITTALLNHFFPLNLLQ